MTGEPNDEDDRPWEQPGSPARRDCERHRGVLLVVLADASLALGITALLAALPGLIALPMGGVIWLLSARDLQRMKAGLVDRDGQHFTRQAHVQGRAAVSLSLLGLAIWVGVSLGLLLWLRCQA
jgi:hypothetical protein